MPLLLRKFAVVVKEVSSRVVLAKTLTQISYGKIFNLIATTIIKILRSALKIVFQKIIKILIRFWHAYLAVRVKVEQIYGATSVRHVHRLRPGTRNDAGTINS